MGRISLDIRDAPDFRSQAAALILAWWYWARLGFIGGVSAYDTYLTFALRDVILFTEQNPMGLWLIRLDPHRLTYFTAAKTAGTLVVLTLMGIAAPIVSPSRGADQPPSPSCDCRGLHRFLVHKLVRPLGRTMRHYREPIVTTLATFQLWLLWYLSTE